MSICVIKPIFPNLYINYKINPFPSILNKYNLDKKTVFAQLNRGNDEDPIKESEWRKREFDQDVDRYFDYMIERQTSYYSQNLVQYNYFEEFVHYSFHYYSYFAKNLDCNSQNFDYNCFRHTQNLDCFENSYYNFDLDCSCYNKC